MRSRLFRLPSVIAPSLLAAGAWCASPALAQSVAEFYRGKTVTLIVNSASGGGYDTLSRVLANHLGRHSPGGAGSIKADVTQRIHLVKFGLNYRFDWGAPAVIARY